MAAPLLLVGSAGLGRETLAAVRAGSAATSGWTTVGILDDDPRRWGTAVDGVSVLGPLDAVRDHPDAAVVIAVGRGSARLAIADRLAALGLAADRFASVVHPAASVGDGCTVGAGSVLLAGVVLTAGVTLGHHVVCMPAVVLTHDDVVEDAVTLCAGVVLGGGVRVGRAAYVGMNAAVRENLVVGARAVIGMGAVVLRDVAAGQRVAGVPARPLRTPDPALPAAVGGPMRSPEGTP